MEVALEEEYPEQAAKCRELLDQQSYTAAAALLSTLIPDLFHRGKRARFLHCSTVYRPPSKSLISS